MAKKSLMLVVINILLINALEAQYISEVLEYKPAPGQFINTAYASPYASESIKGGVQGMLSLGAFGGYVVFKFENPVENDLNNPYGVDFTVFGNPLKDPNTGVVIWAEHGIVSVMKDDNGNGLPDDTWYELAGSDYFSESTIHDYSVTYTNPNQEIAVDVPWVDNQANSGLILINEWYTQPYYPMVDSFPNVSVDTYTLTGTRVEDELDDSNPTNISSSTKRFGYVDNQPRELEFMDHTIPNNPYTIERENSGGDAFDISWAVDSGGNYVDLDVIHFVKVHTGVQANAGWLGEVSTEVAGAVDVLPNPSITGVTDILLMDPLPDTINTQNYPLELVAFLSGRYTPDVDVNWDFSLEGTSVNADNELSFTFNGQLILTVMLSNDPSVFVTDTAIVYDPANIGNAIQEVENEIASVQLYPNPANDKVYIYGIEQVNVEVYDVTGKMVLNQFYNKNNPIKIQNLDEGIYLVKVLKNKQTKTLRLVKC